MATTLHRHPVIHTGVPHDAPVTGILVDDDIIIATGDAGQLADDADEIHDLEGAAVIPGLHDAHIHTASLARSLDAVDLRGCRGRAEALGRIAEHSAEVPGTTWLGGGRWDSNRWNPPGRPDRRALDSVTPDRPVLLSSIDGHTAWANSEALRRAGVTADTPDPAGGRLERDLDGRPTGILRESAIGLVAEVMEREHDDDLPALLARVQQRLLGWGLTSITDIDGEDARAAFTTLHRAGDLAVRVHKAVLAGDLETALAERRRSGDGDNLLSTGPVKIFADGALGSHTCLMTHAFAGDPDNHGIEVTPVADIEELARRAITHGLCVATHAIGDRANRNVLDAYERIGTVADPRLRLRIEHAQYLRSDDVARMARLGVIASMQPTHCTTDFDLVDAMLTDSGLVAYGWRTLLRAGVRLAFGSDAPVESANPFLGLHAAVTRQRRDGAPPGGWRPAERLTIGEALAAHTVGSAYAVGAHHRVGTLAAGQLADFVALTADPFRVTPADIATITPVATVVGGRIRWRRVL